MHQVVTIHIFDICGQTRAWMRQVSVSLWQPGQARLEVQSGLGVYYMSSSSHAAEVVMDSPLLTFAIFTTPATLSIRHMSPGGAHRVVPGQHASTGASAAPDPGADLPSINMHIR